MIFTSRLVGTILRTTFVLRTDWTICYPQVGSGRKALQCVLQSDLYKLVEYVGGGPAPLSLSQDFEDLDLPQLPQYLTGALSGDGLSLREFSGVEYHHHNNQLPKG